MIHRVIIRFVYNKRNKQSALLFIVSNNRFRRWETINYWKLLPTTTTNSNETINTNYCTLYIYNPNNRFEDEEQPRDLGLMTSAWTTSLSPRISAYLNKSITQQKLT